MEPIITSLSSSSTESFHNEHNGYDHEHPSPTTTAYHYKKVNIPLAYPSEAIKEQSSTPKAYIYPPLMSPSDEFFSPQQGNATSPTSSQPISIPQSQGQRHWQAQGAVGRRNSMPVKPLSSSATAKWGVVGSMPEPSHMPSPPTSPWKRSNSFTKPTRSATTLVLDETPYPELPPEVRTWTSWHVAEYLGYSLRLYPRAITDDLGRYVRQTACLTGAQFIDLREEDLERMQINLKWRSMILKAVGMLRRETIRASRIDELNWEDGYEPEKDGPMPVSPSASSSDEDPSPSTHHSASATTESETTHVQNQSHSTTTTITNMENSKQVSHDATLDAQELRRGIVEDISSVLLSWKKDQEAKVKKVEASSSNLGGLGFMEGVVIGGLIVAFMMRFSR